MQIASGEGDSLHATKLRSDLAYLDGDIDLAYARPTLAEYSVFQQLDRKAEAGEQKLDAAMAAAQRE